MKKIFLALGLVATTLSFVACNSASKDATIDSLRAANEVLSSENQSKDADIDSLFAMLNEIEDNLSMINSKYSNVQEMRRNNTEGSYDRKKEIREQMSSIENMMADNKAKIARLNNRANELGRKNTDLQAYITRLEERSAAQEAQIAELLTELENNKVVIKGLNKNVSELTASNQQKDEYIAQQIADANRAYFVVGTYDELKAAGIVKKSGGFIGIGRKQGTVADMNTEKFTEIDRTKVSTISINKKKAVVISQHPENSYELVYDEDNSKVVAYLRILNPTQFWQYTKYLVISTK
jgi:hypothetical protein